MKERIQDKIDEIENAIHELEKAVPESFEEYTNSRNSQLICERLVEIIIESVVDLAFLVIKLKEFRMPEEDEGSFDVLFNEKIIHENLANNLKKAKGMRNIIAHEYGKIDDSLVFHSAKEEISKDVNEFIECVKQVIK